MSGMQRDTVVMDHDGELEGRIVGDVIVRRGCRVRISAMISGDLHVEQGAQAEVSGLIAGRVMQDGGRVLVTGLA
ncbi:hypothetical protein [Sphingomonas sp. GV3]|uniref:hypothetical protein n=1 Tax=Sphingomonas TaxID=13687 RepID=UPI0035B5BA23